MIRGKDVRIARIYQARCTLTGCDWSGELVDSYREANVDRVAHVNDHKAAETAADPLEEGLF